ncbi:LysE/ArgO family amino acid transporter [Fusobacterium sp.]|uniref:LysE/ArgO family amino acid transporter n=1 Tax=Fusobacterium sp. TaxID=68766 RepID=UPI0028FE1C90|nr:LysE family transporter [Fusobacterium sp.]MDU1911793.1 LysE family transporter [Fusobacterium sp.]
MKYLLQGLTMGLAYVAPIGLQNLFVINTALTHKKSRAFLTAFIVIFFDITLALACFFGIGTIMEKSKLLEMGILFIGSLVILYIGIGLVKAKGMLNNSTDVNIPLIKVVTTACVVTWFNPQAIIDGSMMLGAFRASLPKGEGLKFILGVAFASCIWFIGMTIFINCFSNRITEKILRIINVVCGIVIIFYGIKLFYNFIQMVT